MRFFTNTIASFTSLGLMAIWALAFGGQVAYAQTQTVAQARLAGAGAVVTVAGTVTNGGELGQIRYLQDATGGIAAYFQASQLAAQPVRRGDSILITGTLKQFQNLLEFDPIASYTIVATGRTLPAPVTVSAANALSLY